VLTLQNLETNLVFLRAQFAGPNIMRIQGILVVSIAYQAQGVISILLAALACGKAHIGRPDAQPTDTGRRATGCLTGGAKSMKIW
jgi:hypothetical protein